MLKVEAVRLTDGDTVVVQLVLASIHTLGETLPLYHLQQADGASVLLVMVLLRVSSANTDTQTVQTVYSAQSTSPSPNPIKTPPGLMSPDNRQKTVHINDTQ